MNQMEESLKQQSGMGFTDKDLDDVRRLVYFSFGLYVCMYVCVYVYMYNILFCMRLFTSGIIDILRMFAYIICICR